MEFEFTDIRDAVDQLLQQARGKGLTDTERDVLQGIWEGQQYQAMSERFNRSPKTLKQSAYQLWKPLSSALKRRVHKSNFRTVLESYLRERAAPATVQPVSSNSHPSSQSAVVEPRSVDTLDALGGLDCNSHGFVGRTQELDQLSDQIQSGFRLILMNGTSGIGKTRLVGQLVERVRHQFTYVLYRRASDIPRLVDWYAIFANLTGITSDRTEQLSDSAIISAVMPVLRQHRCLIIIDQAELFYKPDVVAGTFSDRGSSYRQLLLRVIEEQHESCFIWISREQPNYPMIQTNCVSLYSLTGLLTNHAQQLLQQQRLRGSAVEQQQLIELCGNHPKLLLTAASCIESRYHGAIADFLNNLIPLPKYLVTVLSEMLGELAEPEAVLLYWFILQPLSTQDLGSKVTPDFPLSRLNDAWDGLGRRRVVVQDANHQFRVLHPPLLVTYVAQYLVDQLLQELMQGSLNLLHRYPVQMTTVPAYQQEQQRDRILQPLATQFQQACRDQGLIPSIQLIQVLHGIREDSPPQSYAAGNVMVIAGYLDISLTGCDFSGLTIRQADLRYIQLHQVNCSHCLFAETVFATGQGDRLVAALRPDGSSLLVGDVSGRVTLWRLVGEQVQFVRYSRLEHAITLMTFGADGSYAVATAGRTIHIVWNEQSELTAAELISMPTEIRSLALSPDGEYVAAGLADGRVMVYSFQTERCYPLRSHTAAVLQVAFSADSRQLASYSDDHRVLIWNLTTLRDISLQSTAKEMLLERDSTSLVLGWQDSQLQVAEIYQNGRVQLRSLPETTPMVLNDQGNTLALALSADIRYLVISNRDRAVRLWDCETGAMIEVIDLLELPALMVLSRDAHLLLTNTRSQVQLWDMTNKRCLWKISAGDVAQPYEGFNVRNATGISPEIRQMITDLGALY
jgi:hypothetical protein